MKYWSEYEGHKPEILGKRKKFDNTIYTFDIETTSYIEIDGNIRPAIEYDKLTEDEKEKISYGSNMYVWQLGINDTIYYGRTWEELHLFLGLIDEQTGHEQKYLFIHNLSFEFHFLSGEFAIENVLARISRKVMKCNFKDYNFEMRCTYYMSNCALKQLPALFNLPVEKQVGDLDYTKLRHTRTELTEKELKYCEYDCLVVYYYIKYELEEYETVKNIPLTSTGHVRRELKELVQKDYKYKRLIKNAQNTDPHIYSLLTEAFAGGYTHANCIYTDKIINDVDSWDFTSSYPYVMVSHRFPMKTFKPCKIKKREDMIKSFAYLLVVEFEDIYCKYWNNFISKSKCRNIVNGKYDNGRIIQADKIEIVLTDIDFYFIMDTYNIKSYKIKESYFSKYDYLPKTLINFILDKYVAKTQYKNVAGKELNYIKEKNKFNAIFGMSVTNTIRDEVLFDNIDGWSERELTNEEILEALQEQIKNPFLEFSIGCWVTSTGRNNLLRNLIKLDEHAIYCDTDSIKLMPGYDKKVIEDYNIFVKNKLEHVSKLLDIPYERFAPKDKDGIEHLLGVFDDDGHYNEFITQGAKKYAFTKYIKNNKIQDWQNIIERGEEKSLVLDITVAGVPKQGAKCLKSLEDFEDNLVFTHDITNKNMHQYIDNQEPKYMTDYQGNRELITDKKGICILPTTYVLGKALEYTELITEASSKRAKFKEEKND